jgi:Na+-driven multidrug efflux pump
MEITIEKKSILKRLFGTQDLTIESPLKVILIFAIPLLLANVLSNSLSLINSLVLKSTVGGDSVTAMNQTGSLSSLLFQFAFGCSSGFSIIASQKFGSKDDLGLRKTFFSSIMLSLLIGVVVTMVGLISLDELLNLLNIDMIYYAKAKIYFSTLLIGFVLSVLSNLFGNFLRALGNSLFPLVLSFGTTAIYILIVYLLTAKNIANLDTLGCAIATIFINFVSVIANFLYLIHIHPTLLFKKEAMKPDKSIYLDLLKLGLPLGFQWSILFIGSFVQNSQINLFGSDASKAVTCYSNWESYLTMLFNVIANALLTFVGQNYGSKNYYRIKVGLRDSFFIVLTSYALCLIVGLPTIDYVPYIFLNDVDITPIVLDYTRIYLTILIPALILQGLLMISRSSLQGIKRPLIPFFSSIGELVARILVSLFIPKMIDSNFAVTHNEMSYLGLCFSNASAWFVSFLVMGISVLVLIVFNKKYAKTKEFVGIDKKS